MEENQEIIARALEIAVNLTGAKGASCIKYKDGNVYIQESVLKATESIIRIMYAKDLSKIAESSKECPCFTYPLDSPVSTNNA